MSDILVDFRKERPRLYPKEEGLFRYFEDIVVRVVEFQRFSVVVARADDFDTWGPFRSNDGQIFVALGGRIALDGRDWREAKSCDGSGGLACKAIYQKYIDGGIKSLHDLNGNFLVLLYDGALNTAYIVTDRCGMYPCFLGETNNQGLVVGSHQDILAQVCNVEMDWDTASMAEFLISGRVSFPYTYYKGIRALEYGAVHKFSVSGEQIVYETASKYFNFDYKLDPAESEWDLAEELGLAFRNAMTRRVLPLFGKTAVSLSGGLDSRALLCSIGELEQIWSFCFFDEENLELSIARKIAESLDVKFIPYRRDFEHYGGNAEMGVRISGGMGDFGSNHYLGFRDRLRKSGIENIIAGFYCDYLFKGLALNRRTNKLLRKESLADFQYENYMPLYWFDTSYSEQVRGRLEEAFPDEIRKDSSDYGVLRVEQKRLFPLCYEPDHQETVVPQRVLGWYLPIVDNDIIDVYLRIPPRYKLNTSMYSKMVKMQCGDKISKIININTGARVNANRGSIIFNGLRMALIRRVKSLRHSLATDESWPNWDYYVENSKTIEALWLRKNSVAEGVLGEITGQNPFLRLPRDYLGKDLKLFLRMLTLKSWLDQRVGIRTQEN